MRENLLSGSEGRAVQPSPMRRPYPYRESVLGSGIPQNSVSALINWNGFFHEAGIWPICAGFRPTREGG
jgi:hypothetical protein